MKRKEKQPNLISCDCLVFSDDAEKENKKIKMAKGNLKGCLSTQQTWKSIDIMEKKKETTCIPEHLFISRKLNY